MTRILYRDRHVAGRDEDATARWGWFVALGIGFLLLSLLAFGNLVAATVASVFLVGMLMLIGAVAQLAEAFQVQRWGGFSSCFSAASSTASPAFSPSPIRRSRRRR